MALPSLSSSSDTSTRALLGGDWRATPRPFPPIPVPGKSLQDYTPVKIKAGLAYADERRRAPQRKLSPLAEAAIRRYESACKDALLAKSQQESFDAISRLREYEKSLAYNTLLDGAGTEDMQKMMDKLIHWRRLELFARYGDYLVRICREFKKKAQLYETEFCDLLSKWDNYWTDINRSLQEEKPRWEERGKTGEVPNSDVKMHLAVKSACQHVGLDYTQILQAIRLYADQNELMHASVDELITRADWYALARQLSTDWAEVEAVVPEHLHWTTYLIKKLIRDMIADFFDLRVESAQPSSWIARPKLADQAIEARKESGEEASIRKARHQKHLDAAAKKYADNIKKGLEYRAAFKGSKDFKATLARLPASSKEPLMYPRASGKGKKRKGKSKRVASGDLPEGEARKTQKLC